MRQTKYKDHKYKDPELFLELVREFDVKRVYIDWHRLYSYIHIWFDHNHKSHRIVVDDIEILCKLMNKLMVKTTIIPVKHYGWL